MAEISVLHWIYGFTLSLDSAPESSYKTDSYKSKLSSSLRDTSAHVHHALATGHDSDIRNYDKKRQARRRCPAKVTS